MATILIEKDTRTKLRSAGHKGQSYDDIIKELLKQTEKHSADLWESAKQEKM
jgi:predicted CopG family antitoxin